MKKEKFFSYLKKCLHKKNIFQTKKFYLLKKRFLSRILLVEEKKMKLIVKISINHNQNQMKKTVETQTECETDNESDIEFVRITNLHPRECLKRKRAKIDYW